MKNMSEIFAQVKKEILNGDVEAIHYAAKGRILELFSENDIPETEYKPYMGNNVLPEFSLKG